MINPLKLGWNIAVLFPLSLFLFFYSNNIYFIFMGMGLFLYLGYLSAKHYNQAPITQLPVLLVLLFSFFAYGIHHLGTSYAPQTFVNLPFVSEHNKTYDPSPDEYPGSYLFDKGTRLNKLCYYTGIIHTINIQAVTDKKVQLFSTEDNYPQSFQWTCHTFPITTVSKITIRPTKNIQQELGEVAFFLGEKRLVPSSGNEGLLDESYIVPDSSAYGGMYFDEIYHGRTAYEHIHTDRPLYETTHPMLGKEIISIGVRAFGMTPFGWRIMPFVFGVFFILLMFHFSKQITGKKFFGLVGAFFTVYSFIHITQSRIALVDVFGTFFILASYFALYVFIKKQKLKYLILSGILFGLASGVKWSAVFGAGGFLIIAGYLLVSRYPLEKRFSGWKLIFWGVMTYGVLSVAVYVLTFYPLIQRGEISFAAIYDAVYHYNFNMLDYHVLEATPHAYGSPWWSWLIDLRPMCIYRDKVNDAFSSINFLGNPLIFIPGLLAVLYTFVLFIKERKLEQLFILAGYLSLLAPYAFISRIMFIYHYSYSLYFLILALVYTLYRLSQNHKIWYLLTFIYLTATSVLFMYYYNVLTGYPMLRSELPESMNMLSTWAL